MDPSVRFSLDDAGQLDVLGRELAQLRMWVAVLTGAVVLLFALGGLAALIARRRHQALVDDVGLAVREALTQHFAAHREVMHQLDLEGAVVARRLGERFAEISTRIEELADAAG